MLLSVLVSNGVVLAQVENTDTLSANLKEIEVVARRKLITTDTNKITYDVSGDREAATMSVLEILRKVPMITVDSEDNIKLNGSSDFKIYKNGKPAGMLTSKEVLATLQAGSVKSIEVITSPGARYDAEGVNGIINIVMKERNIFDGVAGSARAWANNADGYSGNIHLMEQSNKFSLNMNYGHSQYGDRQQKFSFDNEYVYNESGNRMVFHNQSIEAVNMHTFTVDAGYEVDSLNRIAVSFDGTIGSFEKNATKNFSHSTLFTPSGDVVYSYDEYTGMDYRLGNYSGRVDYQRFTHRKGEVLSLSYLMQVDRIKNNYTTDYEDIVNIPVDYLQIHCFGRQKCEEHTFQFDYTRPLSNVVDINVGTKYILRRNRSTENYRFDNGVITDSDFSYNSRIGAFYGELDLNWGTWKLKMGARHEYSRLKGIYHDRTNQDFSKELNDLVPSVGIGYELNDRNSLSFNYSMKIKRPTLKYIDPAVEETPTKRTFGNTMINSAKHHHLVLKYNLFTSLFTLNTSLAYRFSNNLFTAHNYVQDGVRNFTYTDNGSYRTVEFIGYAGWAPAKKTQLSLTFQCMNREVKNRAMNVGLNRWIVFGYLRAEQQLPWKLRLSGSFGHNGGDFESPYNYREATCWHSFDLSRGFLKNNSLQVRLTAYNPFSAKKDKRFVTNIVNGDYTGTSTEKYRSKSLSLTATYRFGKQTTRPKSPLKTITNDDLQK